MMLAITILVFCAGTLLIVVWNVSAWPTVEATGQIHPGTVSVLIPARDEEANLAVCLESVVRQDETVAEILVYDDHSTDATPEIIREYARRDSRVRLVVARELPTGWCGKNFACAQLAQAARGDRLLFLDADARLADAAAARMVAEARRRDVTMLSAWPALTLQSFWEKTLMPMLNFVVFTLFPAPLSLMRDDPSLGLVHGACILLDRKTYHAVGGHAAVRDQIFEDQRLAHLWRVKGYRGVCLDGQHTVSARMYRSFAEIWGGFQKNFFPAFRREVNFWLFLLLHTAVFLAPFILLLWTQAWPVWLAAVSVLTMRALLAIRFKHPLWSVLLHPLAEVILIALGISSWWKCKTGRGVQWKGREYQKAVGSERCSASCLLPSACLNQMKDKKAVVIGGGLGGLAVALRLAAGGWDVTVCEQGERPGGKMNTWSERGFRFDTGPSLITMPWIFEDIFKVAGSRLQDHVELLQINPLADYVYADGARFTYSASLPEWLSTLRSIAPQDVDGFLRFMRLGAQLYEISKETFLRRCPTDPPDARALSALRHMPLRYGWGNYHRTVAAHFTSPYLRQLFDRYPTYVGSSPYRCPATLAVIPYIEYAFGGWYVKGGLYRIVESLVELAERAGIKLLLKSRVEAIEHKEKKVTGARLASGERLAADVVVMNGDASDAPALLGEKDAAGLPPAERSLSGLVFLLGIKRELPELSHHSVYFSADYEREFAELFDERRFPDDPTVYVSAPSRSDRSLVPGGGETLFVMANAPANDGEWDEEKTAGARRRVLARLRRSGFPDIESDVVVTDVWTPRRLAQSYLMPGGAIYGTHSHGWRRAFFRPPNKDRRYAGLYYVGGSTHPGGGTPTVLLSAQITARLIERDA